MPPEDAERAVAVVRAALAADGPLTRAQLRGQVAAAGVQTEGQAMVHILALASIRGLIVRGPVAGRDQAFVMARDWLGADRDLARWAGIGLAELTVNPQRAAAALPPPLLLGAFDPLLLGWASQDFIVGPHRHIVTVNGLFRPFALAGGRAVATWNITRGQVELAPFSPLDAETRAALDTDAADVTRFLGG